MGASNVQNTGHEILRWIEMWDYSGDAIYRGFVAEHNNERTMFVFFDREMESGLKSGYVTSCVSLNSARQTMLKAFPLGFLYHSPQLLTYF